MHSAMMPFVTSVSSIVNTALLLMTLGASHFHYTLDAAPWQFPRFGVSHYKDKGLG